MASKISSWIEKEIIVLYRNYLYSSGLHTYRNYLSRYCTLIQNILYYNNLRENNFLTCKTFFFVIKTCSLNKDSIPGPLGYETATLPLGPKG